jgi:hypothetical protein
MPSTNELLMVPTQTVQRCPRCSGQVYQGFDGESSCLHCGEVFYPPRPVARFKLDLDALASDTLLRRGRGRPRRTPPPEAGAA